MICFPDYFFSATLLSVVFGCFFSYSIAHDADVRATAGRSSMEALHNQHNSQILFIETSDTVFQTLLPFFDYCYFTTRQLL
jgi:hypothetical protein